MKKACIAIALVAAVLAPGAASAAPPAGSVPAHQHYVVTATGVWVPVGPNSCERGTSRQFDEFHTNVHRGIPGDMGVITALGCG